MRLLLRSTLAVAVAAPALALAGCGSHSANTSTTTTTTTSPPSTTSVGVYFLADGKLALVNRRVPETRAVATASVDELLAGPTSSESARGITSAIPPGTRLLDLKIASGVATVNLSQVFSAPGDDASIQSRAAQVVFTVTQFSTADSVMLEVNGAPWGAVPQPGRRADYEGLAPAIIVESPVAGDTVHSPIDVRGTADTFEATVNYQVVDSTGKVLHEGYTTATAGSGTRGSFSASVPFSVTDVQDGALLVFDYSAENGAIEHLVRVPLKLEPTS